MITLKTLEIDKSKYKISNTYLDAIKYFIASLNSDIGSIVKEKNLIVGKTKLRTGKPVELDLACFYEYDSDIQVLMNLQGFHREVFGTESIVFNIPGIVGGTKVNEEYITNMILLPLVKDGFFDDEYLNFIKPLLFILPIYYNKENGKVGFSVDYYKTSYVVTRKGYCLGKIDTVKISVTDLLDIEVGQGFTNKEIGDKDRSFGFTHKIRELIGMKFFYWQKQVIKTWRKINVVFAVRNSGKTAFACYVGLREIISEKKGFGIRKNRKVIYFVPDKVDIGEQIMDYIEGYIDAIFEFALKQLLNSKDYLDSNEFEKENLRYEYQTKLQSMRKTYFRIDRTNYYIKCNITGHSLKIVSLQDVLSKSGKGLGTSKGEGLACDVAIIEEAPRIPDAFWNSFWERAETECDYVYVSGTINLETPKNHWSYKLAIEGELGNPDISTHRISLYNNENLFHALEEKDVAGKQAIIERERIKLLSQGLKNLYCRGYGIILDESKVFNVMGNIYSEIEKGNDYDHRVIVEDFGGDSDPIGFIVYNINTQHIEKAVRYKGFSIQEQIALVEKEKRLYQYCFTLGDGTGVGRLARSSDLNSEIEYYITFTSGPEWNYNSSKGYWSSDKSYMVELAKAFFNKGVFKIHYQQLELIEDLESFVKITGSNARVQQYEAKAGKTDDLVACILMLSVFLVKVLGLIDKQDFKKFGVNLEKFKEQFYTDMENGTNTNNYFNGLY